MFTGELSVDYMPCINYAMMLNDHTAFNEFELTNNSDNDWHNIKISISGDMIEPCILLADCVAKGETVSFDNATILPTARKLIALTEAVASSFIIRVSVDGEPAASKVFPLTLMAFDQWTGNKIMPELVASFVTPNHPCISPICLEASKHLEELTGISQLDSYFSYDYDRILKQVESIYTALLDKKLVYITAPPSFEESGQRVRMVNNVLDNGMGTCLDLSLLLCSCFEQIGLLSMIVLYKGHAVAGVWIDPLPKVPMVGYDASDLITYTNEDYSNLLLIESTCLTSGDNFATACKSADLQFQRDYDNFVCFVDIAEARRNGVRPLPHFIHTESGWEVDKSIDYDKSFAELASKNPYDIQGLVSSKKLKDKQFLWERKLLDLSLRNNLLNMKMGKLTLPIQNLSIESVLSHLQMEYLINDLDPVENFDTIKALYRAARLSLEENGANTLFLAVGTMRWYEVDGSRAFRAPIMFVPLEIVRHGAKKYLIRLRDEEPIMNITLIEMMRQTFDMVIPEISPASEDDAEVLDWQRVFDTLSSSISELNESRPVDKQWEIVEECHIGIFSFTKFVMWNDIHSNPDVLLRQPLIRSLIEGRLQFDDKLDEADARELDKTATPEKYAIPLPVDSSQLEAVANAGKGRSFILYGPPGTGKSQTITNIIANALYHGKRVLFVSEKKAALEVVQQRLTNIGLKPYCLELHSNKADKKSFLAQMELALNQEQGGYVYEFAPTSKDLFSTRKELNSYIESLHCIRENGLSLYDCINRYLDIDADEIKLSYEQVKDFTPEFVDDIADKLSTLDVVESIIKMHPSKHPLLGLYPLENTADNQNKITDMLNMMPKLMDMVRHKEKSLFNRWFLHRSLTEILSRRKEWMKFRELADIEDDILNDFDKLEKSLSVWQQNADLLRHWYHYSLRAYEIKQYGMPAILNYYLQGNSGANTALAFRKSYYKCVASYIIGNDKALRGFNGLLFEDVIARYRNLESRFKEVTKKELVSKLSQRIPQANSNTPIISKELAFLRKKIATRGRATSVRRLINETRHLLPKLCPCILMSPLSVAQYLEMRPNQFDLVIFDEASQMPTCEAVGAIARGKAVVIVGDPQQMPPTSFFVTQNTGDSDADIDDLESILDDCISLSMPSAYLNWHYRSRHESLISFSNRHFYGGKLITFPSVDDQLRKVTLQHVDGYYDLGKSRSNKAEAKAIVDEVIMRLSRMITTDEHPAEEPTRSIGIVAFSKVQSTLIEDMLNDALAKHPELEKFAMSGGEPIFVKNLENVQGDERDIILFSVGYGPDKNGKVSMNFGPLNQVGGERRLNVAVSRARYEMKLFSTLEPYQIDLQRTNAVGVRMLKQFLEYAENGTLPKPANQAGRVEVAPIIRLLADELQSKGEEVHFNVGKSKFRIDLAVVDKENPSRYKAGIITDGKSYYAVPTARDREIVQPSILTSLGWKLKHAFTVDRI